MGNQGKRSFEPIRLGKLDNGVALFDFVDGTKVIIKTDNNGNIVINFNTKKYDKKHTKCKWYSKDFLINRSENGIVFKELNVLYSNYLEVIKTDLQRYTLKENNEVKQKYSLCNTVCGDKIELLYHSDEGTIGKTSAIGIIKYDKNNYILRFHRSIKEPENQTVLIKNKDSKYPELFWLYNNFLNKINKLPMLQYSLLDSYFHNQNSDMSKEISSGRQLKPTVKH